jgi:hypothetical protein
MKNRISTLLALVIVPLGACQGRDLGARANTVDREYSKPASEVCVAVRRSAEAAGLNVRSDKHDVLGGDLMTTRGDGTEVRIHVKSLGKKCSLVSVRVEPDDRDLANLMHERIAGTLEEESGASIPSSGAGQ